MPAQDMWESIVLNNINALCSNGKYNTCPNSSSNSFEVFYFPRQRLIILSAAHIHNNIINVVYNLHYYRIHKN